MFIGFTNWEKSKMTEKFADYAANGSFDMMTYGGGVYNKHH